MADRFTHPADVAAFAQFTLGPREIHKPTKSGTGSALKIQLRLEPIANVTFGDDGTVQSLYFEREANKAGGLFLELAAQIGQNERGNALFGWRDEQTLIRSKLGIADVQNLISGIRRFRAGFDVQSDVRGRDGAGNQISLFHKFASASGNATAAISYTLEDESGSLRISRSKDLARQIKLTLGEELVFVRYLELALDAFLRVGKR